MTSVSDAKSDLVAHRRWKWLMQMAALQPTLAVHGGESRRRQRGLDGGDRWIDGNGGRRFANPDLVTAKRED
ncbi:hypothetical protein L1049_019752 [Liquidambar formosana]|uniref:Uncharacterized protein n=1 Tax=Liquidambar formosana TaxID=63359 RepID=A0AAP0X6R9_LIQFO